MVSRGKGTKRKTANRGDVTLEQLVAVLDSELRVNEIRDASSNGLQVQGAPVITKVALAVDACLEAYRLASEKKCQFLITHHGLIWDGVRSITGAYYNQVKYLIENNLSLYAAHLPLDLHPVYGNNACLASVLGLTDIKPFGYYKGVMIGFEGILPKEKTNKELCLILDKQLDCKAIELPFGKNKNRRIAIVSGGAAGELPEAVRKGIDCYVTGEPGHANHHTALEGNINVIYCGHYHSEKPGVEAIGKFITETFAIETEFLDIPTIV